MTTQLTRDEVIAALIRHPDLELETVRSSDVWKLLAGDPVDPEVTAVLERRLAELDVMLKVEDEYREKGIWTLTCLDEDCPQRLHERLGTRAPALLHGFGERSLLARDGIGVVGSRNLDAEAETVTAELARTVAAGNRVLVSGGARGADQIAMSAAAERGGSVVGVLVHPLAKRMREPEVRVLAEDGRICLVTPFRPDMGFTVANAMARNRIIYALTECTVVVASDHGKGGSWAGATEAMRWKLTQVAAWTGAGAGPGNPALVEKGATPLDEVGKVLDPGWLREGAGNSPGGQMNLFT